MVIVVLVPEDLTALCIFPIMDLCILACTHMPVCTRTRFGFVNTGLALFLPHGFFVRELAGLDALFDALFLIDGTLHNGLHTLG